jgi:hypothetical protein
MTVDWGSRRGGSRRAVDRGRRRGLAVDRGSRRRLAVDWRSGRGRAGLDGRWRRVSVGDGHRVSGAAG